MDEKVNKTELYHEKQRLQYCAVHAINNLFQSADACSKATLDEICYNLNPSRWLNPHRSMLGLGNYDINVITMFLQSREHEVVWFDKRRPAEDIKLEEVFGFLLNDISKQSLFGKTFSLSSSFKHWYIIREFNNDCYFNLDSKLPKPLEIGDDKLLIEYLNTQLIQKECQLLLVVKTGRSGEDVYNNKDAG